MYFRCEECNYVSTDAALAKPKHACPNCNEIAGEFGRRMFPPLETKTYKRMIKKHFTKVEVDTIEILKAASEIISMPYGQTKAIFDELTSNNEESLEDALENIKTKTLLNDDVKLYEILRLTLEYSSCDEMKMCVVLVDAFVESLLFNFLDELLCFERISGNVRRALVDQIKSRQQLLAYIESYLDIKLNKFFSVSKYGEEFYDNIINIRRKRNKFIHASPYAITRNDYDKALGVSEKAIGVFAELNNNYLVKRKVK